MPVQSQTSDRSRSRAPVIIVNGDKGGPGKSFAARTLIWKLIKRGHKVVAIDGDQRNGHVERFYPGLTLLRCDLRATDGWSDAFDLIETLGDDVMIVVDLPGGVGEQIHLELARLRLAFEEFDRDVFHVWVADHQEDSVRLFINLYALSPAPNTVFVMNARNETDLTRFRLWFESGTRKRFLAEGGVEASLPGLYHRAHDKIAFSHAPFTDVSIANFSTAERLSFKLWSGRVEESLAPLLRLVMGEPT